MKWDEKYHGLTIPLKAKNRHKEPWNTMNVYNVRSGQMIVLEPGMPHAVNNVEDTVAIGYSYFNMECLPYIECNILDDNGLKDLFVATITKYFCQENKEDDVLRTFLDMKRFPNILAVVQSSPRLRRIISNVVMRIHEIIT